MGVKILVIIINVCILYYVVDMEKEIVNVITLG